MKKLALGISLLVMSQGAFALSENAKFVAVDSSLESSFCVVAATQGYDAAKADLKNPLAVSEANMDYGKKMYDIYCASCHGKTGKGDGILVEREKYLGVPNYKDRDITEGSIYHVIMYGRNMMGSHSSQLTAKERWQVTMYVQQLRSELLK